MKSQLANKAQLPFVITTDSDDPNVFRKLSRSCERCKGCLKDRSDLADASLMGCKGCASMLYCSKTCQVSHWRKGHKNDCRKVANDLAKFQEACPIPSFLAEFIEWKRSSKILLFRLAVAIIRESASLPGACGTPEDLTRDFFVFVEADHTPGNRLPFRIRDEYSLGSIDTLEGISSHPNCTMSFAELAKTMRDTNPEGEGKRPSSDFLILKMIVKVGNMSRAHMTNMPREYINDNIEGSEDVTASMLIMAINDGVGGVGTTKTSRRIRG